MFVVVKYPSNYSVKTGTFDECKEYLNNLHELFTRFTIKSEKTETFLTTWDNEETTYSIEHYNN
jgi:hypothetical protein